MIDLSAGPYDSALVRTAGLHANNVEELQKQMELAMRMGDAGMTLACAYRLVAQAHKVADKAAWHIERGIHPLDPLKEDI